MPISSIIKFRRNVYVGSMLLVIAGRHSPHVSSIISGSKLNFNLTANLSTTIMAEEFRLTAYDHMQAQATPHVEIINDIIRRL